MGWDEIGALAALAGTLVVLAGSVAAVVQLKHLRLTYQVESYIELMKQLNSPEMVAASEYMKTCDFDDPEQLEKALNEGIDQRVRIYGGFYQIVARLINLGVADRDLFAPFVTISPPIWKKLRPLVYAWREQNPSNPRWADIEYLVFNAVDKPPFNVKRYSAAFRARLQMDRALEIWQAEARDALSR